MDSVRIIEIKQSVFADNDREADRVRTELKRKGTFPVSYTHLTLPTISHV